MRLDDNHINAQEIFGKKHTCKGLLDCVKTMQEVYNIDLENFTNLKFKKGIDWFLLEEIVKFADEADRDWMLNQVRNKCFEGDFVSEPGSLPADMYFVEDGEVSVTNNTMKNHVCTISYAAAGWLKKCRREDLCMTCDCFTIPKGMTQLRLIYDARLIN